MVYEVQSPKVDLHNHFWITTDKGRCRLDRFERNLDTLVQSMERGRIDISALTNSQDLRYEQIVKNLKDSEFAKSMQVDIYPNCLILDGKKLVFRGEEIHTTEGDLVLVGAKRTLWKPRTPISLSEAVKIGKEEGLFILAPHVYSSHGGIGEHVQEVCQDVDAIELNPNCTVVIPGIIDKRRDNKKAEQFVKDKNIPLIWTSDGHWPDETGRGYFEIIGKLKFENGEKALEKIKEVVRASKYQTRGRLATPYEIARLIAVTLYDLDFRRPLGLVRSTFEANF